MRLSRIWSRPSQPVRDEQTLERIDAIVGTLATANDGELAAKTRDLKANGRHDDSDAVDLLAWSFALTYEATRRVLGLRYFREQLLAGLALTRGEVAEMQTGEGKTITAILPACWWALACEGVHVMTVNAYLAERDYATLGPVYQTLGFSLGLTLPGSLPAAKREAYYADVTYGPGYEFGFDFLRDQTTLLSQRRPKLGEQFSQTLRGIGATAPQLIQRGHAAAIVDEADSVLIDEATVPLVLSGQGGQPADNAEVYRAARQAALSLEADRDFIADPSTAELQLTQQGLDRLSADVDRCPAGRLDRPWQRYVEQALRAELFYQRDVHYVVRENTVHIVDPHTGRIFADRTWRDGLHQLVEAKEGVPITDETRSIGKIMRQKYFQLYDSLCGMTGTAQGCQKELHEVYGTGVAVIPPHKHCRRISLPARLFANQASKERAIAQSIAELQPTRRPVLVGTSDIESSRRLSQLLTERDIAHHVLNGLQDEGEAALIARAGEPGMITIATNMAGRGTDIKLGAGVAESGGLHVVASEFQLSSRIDRQLIGRAARQGDPGSCQIFASGDDLLIRRHAPDLAEVLRRQADAGGEVAATDKLLERIAKAQRQAEQADRQQRRQMVAHDDWLDNTVRSTMS